MATFTVVGTSTVAAAGAGSVAIPVPSGTSVGDLLIVGFWGGIGVEVTDSRLTPVNQGGILAPHNAGAYGIATDLSDVTLDCSGWDRLAIVLALTAVDGSPVASARLIAPPSSTALAETAGFSAAVVFVADFQDTTSTTGLPVDSSIGDDADWTTQDFQYVTATFDQTGTSIKCFTYVGVDPVPELTSTPSGDARTRTVFVTLLSDVVPVATRPYLRQRQSPRANPRVSLNRPTLRTRQVIP